MLDRLRLSIPFKPEHVTGAAGFLTAMDGIAYGHKGPVLDLKEFDLSLGARSVHIEQGRADAKELYHPWESLPTSFTGLAVKVFHEGSSWPYVELKASPAKLLQGHNVFGPDSIKLGAAEMLKILSQALPFLFDALEVASTEVWELDATFSARLPDEKTAYQVIEFLSNVSNGHTKARGDIYKSTAYWGAKDSRLKKLKAYLKWDEFTAQLDEFKKKARAGDITSARIVKIMSKPELQDWCKNLLRFEATAKKRWLERRGIPSRLIDLIAYQEKLTAQGRNFLREVWQDITKDIFKAFEGQTMRVTNDDAILDALRLVHFRQTPKGNISYAKADKLFLFFNGIRDYGFDGLKSRIPHNTFYRHLRDLEEAGFSKSFLQNLHTDTKANNVFPLLRFVEVDFSSQRPGWYVEPVSLVRAA